MAEEGPGVAEEGPGVAEEGPGVAEEEKGLAWTWRSWGGGGVQDLQEGECHSVRPQEATVHEGFCRWNLVTPFHQSRAGNLRSPAGSSTVSISFRGANTHDRGYRH